MYEIRITQKSQEQEQPRKIIAGKSELDMEWLTKIADTIMRLFDGSEVEIVKVKED